MPSPEFKKIRDEVREKEKEGRLHRGHLAALEEQTYRDLVAEHGKCQRCGRDEKLTLDHIVPRSLLENFGVDTEREYIDGNYQLLCRICNVFKGSRLDFSLPQTKQILITIIEKI